MRKDVDFFIQCHYNSGKWKADVPPQRFSICRKLSFCGAPCVCVQRPLAEAAALFEARRPFPPGPGKSIRGGVIFTNCFWNHKVERELEAGCCIWRSGERLPI